MDMVANAAARLNRGVGKDAAASVKLLIAVYQAAHRDEAVRLELVLVPLYGLHGLPSFWVSPVSKSILPQSRRVSI